MSRTIHWSQELGVILFEFGLQYLNDWLDKLCSDCGLFPFSITLLRADEARDGKSLLHREFVTMRA
jgi:hypothetical protein